MDEISKRIAQLSPAKAALFALRMKSREKRRGVSDEPVAIVGIGCRFPGGVRGPDSFWRLLRDGVDAIREVPAERWDLASWFDAAPDTPGRMYTRWGGFLDDVDKFDPRFFSISPREAITMDPQQRLLMEVGWEALEHAGIAPDTLHGSRTGVFVGICTNDYSHLRQDAAVLDAYTATGNSSSVAAGRLSYFLGLKGPSLAVDTACSSSLVAIHLACQSLRAGESEAALAGGVNLTLWPHITVSTCMAHMMARDGRCKTFDAAADGYVRSEGVGVLVLRRLSDALAAGETVLAVIRGSAVNQDGRSSGLTVPSSPAQQEVLREALASAGVTPEQVGYVEAHGTGTALGDPIEAHALGAIFAGRPPERPPLVVGSSKTNIGHLEAAAGVASVIKAALCLQHAEIPPHLHFERLNPHIPAAEFPFQIPRERMPWPAAHGPRIAGVSAFGFSGTNAHVILEEAPPPAPAPAEREGPYLLTLSARTPEALGTLAERYGEHLATRSDPLADVCATANIGRARLNHRLAVLARDRAELRERLAALTAGRDAPGVWRGVRKAGSRPRVAFLFTGQASQYPGMGRRLYDAEPVFREALDACAGLAGSRLERSLLAVMFGEGDAALLDQTAYTQPAIVALEYALLRLWRSWGIEPSVVLGHSIGEFAAACAADVLRVEDALRLVTTRGRLMQALPGDGAMAAVLAPEERVVAALAGSEGEVSIAAVNGPGSVVISGTRQGVLAVGQRLEAEGIRFERLETSHAFHSHLMEPMLESFERAVADAPFSAPRLPIVSTLTGEVIPGEELCRPSYWRRQIREPVRFAQAMEALRRHGCDVLLELGPKPTLLELGKRCWPEGSGVWLPSLRRGRDDRQQLLETLATLHTSGVEVDWSAVERGPRRRVALPTYPFARERYWIGDVPHSPADSAGEHGPRARAEEPTPLHPLWDHRIELAGGEVYFEKRMLAEAERALADHALGGRIVMPGMALLEMVVAAARAWGGEEVSRVLQLTFATPLVLEPGKPLLVQLALSAAEGREAGFRILSAPEGGEGARRWTEHASGRLGRAAEPPPARLDVAKLRAGCLDTTSPAELYATYRSLGLALGPGFQVVRELRHGQGEGLAVLELASTGPWAPRGFHLHPALVDGGLQAFGGVLMRIAGDAAERRFHYPFAIQECRVYGPIEGKVLAHVRPTPRLDAGDTGIVRGDITFLSMEGAPLCELRGVSVRRAPDALARALADGATGTGPAVPDGIADWFFDVTFRPEPLGASGDPRPGAWLILMDELGVGAALCRLLEKRGHPCVQVRAASRYQRLARDRYGVDPESPGDLQKLVAAIRQDGLELAGAIHLWSCTAPSSEEPTAEALESMALPGALGGLHLAQALAGGGPRRLTLAVVTSYAQAAPASPARLDAWKAPLVGIARVIPKEWDWIACRRIDVDPEEQSADALAALVLAELAAEGSAEAAYRGGQRWVPHWTRLDPGAHGARPLAPRPDGVYLITGGQSGLGLALARQLASRGGTRLVLINRAPLPPEAEWRRIAETGQSGDPTAERVRGVLALRESGAVVWPVQADVADPDAMGRVVSEVRQRFGAIHGVIHAAGLVRDRSLERLDRASLDEVLRPKVMGAWTLHRLTRELPLDFFVLCSSIASLAAPAGQGNYVAGNAFEDALARYRRDVLRLPALSIDWGYWGETGLAATEKYRRAMAATGVQSISTALGQRAFEAALALDRAQVAIANLDARLVSAMLTPRPRGSSAPPPAAPEPRTARPVPTPEPALPRGEPVGDPPVPAPRPAPEAAPPGDLPTRIIQRLVDEVSGVLQLAPEHVDPDVNLMEMGFDSLMALRVKRTLEEISGCALDATLLFEHPTLRALATHLAREHAPAFERHLATSAPPTPVAPAATTPVHPSENRSAEPPPATTADAGSAPATEAPPVHEVAPAPSPHVHREAPVTVRREDVAIIGIGCRLPGAATPEQLWRNLREGRSHVTSLPESRRRLLGRNGRVARWFGGFLDRIEEFDPAVFNLSEADAAMLDPQQRLLMEVTWEALERAGRWSDQLAATRTGVFVGASAVNYRDLLVRAGVPVSPVRQIGNALSMLANRLSYVFDSRGPSLTVDTLCSSSLVALHLGVTSLQRGESDLALVAGVNLTLDGEVTRLFDESGSLAPDGVCLPFNEDGSGYARAEAAVALLLKPLPAALRDGDPIWATIKGTAVVTDGREKAGLVAPSPRGQREAVLEALRAADVHPESIGYMEAHGTATPLGDLIELRALSSAYREQTRRAGFCALGSVKPLIGHSECASGLTGLLSAVLALRHGEIAPTLPLRRPNRNVPLEETPFFLAERPRPWPLPGGPRRAAVHCYAIGGVNAHVILEEAPAQRAERPDRDRPVHALTLSAGTASAAGRLVAEYLAHLEENAQLDLRDVCFTANTGRRASRHRLALVFESREELLAGLRSFTPASATAQPLRMLFEGAAGWTSVSPVEAIPRIVRESGSLPEEGIAALLAWSPGGAVERNVVAGLPSRPAPLPGGQPHLAAPGAWRALMRCLALLHLHGGTVAWEAVDRGLARRRVVLPTYPFERRPLWVEPAPERGAPEPDVTSSRASDASDGVTPSPGPSSTSPAPAHGPPEPAPASAPPTSRSDGPVTPESLEEFLLQAVRAAGHVPEEALDVNHSFMELGLDSVAAVRLTFALERALEIPVSAPDLFEYPNLRALARYLAPRVKSLPAAGPSELARLWTGGGANPIAQPRPEGEPFPTSELQQAYLYAYGMRGNLGGRSSHAYAEMEVRAPLDVPRLQVAIRKLFRRHPMLRCVLLPEGGQRVLPDVPDPELPVTDLRSLPLRSQEAAFLALREELAHEEFDPTRWPLFAIRVCVLEDDRFRFCVSFDLAVMDFQSLHVLMEEWHQLVERPERELPPLSFDFAAYMHELESLRRSERYTRDRAWWRERMRGFPLPPPLPLRADPAGLTAPRFTSRSATLPAEAWRRLQERAQAERVTRSAVLCAAYAQVLADWTGARRFCLNLPVFDRLPIHPEVDRVVGPFSNTILLAVEPDARDTWEGARRIHHASLEALEHRLFTGVELARGIAQHRRAGLTPVAPVVFTAALYGAELRSWGALTAAYSQTPQVWLDCQVLESGGELVIRWDAVEELFTPAELSARFEELVSRIRGLAGGRDPALLPPPARAVIAPDPGGPAEPAPSPAASAPRPAAVQPAPAAVQPSPSTATLHGLFVERAVRQPHQRAVVDGDRSITYRQLDELSNRVANALVAAGVGPGSRVAFLIERGGDVAIASLGILKTGAAFIPIDPGYPDARVQHLLRDSQPARVLTTREQLAARPWLSASPALDLRSAEVTRAPSTPPGVAVKPEALAYIIYTSGSTGRPKGVMISHAGACNTLLDVNRRFSVGRYDRVLGLSSPGFDLSIYDLFGTFAAGATLITVPETSLRDPGRLADLVEAEGATLWSSVPTTMKLLVDHCEGRRRFTAATLRLVMLSGDWIPLTLPDRTRRLFEGARVISLGGATEASIWSCWYPIEEVSPAWRSIPYGKALDGQELLVLGEDLRPPGPGEVGELYIGGVGVALGYWNDPERTNASFPTRPGGAGRIYRTGDLGRLMPDGNVEFLGRRDSQVKVRGFRIELAEVEAAIQGHPAVDSCAVVARGERHDEKELVAFYVPRQPVTAKELRQHLKGVLPEYMVPQRFVERTSLPLNANAKIDRSALNEI